MDDLQRHFSEKSSTIITFDCYGTLVDWDNCACKALRSMYSFPDQPVCDDVLIDMFLELDAIKIRKGTFPYRQVLQNTADCIAESLLGKCDAELSKAFSKSLAHWQVLAETNKALTYLAEHVRSAIISNVYDDLIAPMLTQIHVLFDVVVTSQQTQCYKPERSIFESALRKLDEALGRIIHSAEGLGEAGLARQLA